MTSSSEMVEAKKPSTITKNKMDLEGRVGGRTPLFCAVSNGHVDAAKFLVSKGADLCAKDNSGMTMIHAAAATGNTIMLRYLVKAGFKVGLDIETRDNQGHTAMTYAAKGGHRDCTAFISSHLAKISKLDQDDPARGEVDAGGEEAKEDWTVEGKGAYLAASSTPRAVPTRSCANCGADIKSVRQSACEPCRKTKFRDLFYQMSSVCISSDNYDGKLVN